MVDYCASYFWSVPNSQHRYYGQSKTPQQRLSLKKRDRIKSPYLCELHWLYVTRRIDHKILSLVCSCVNDIAPEYPQELTQQGLPVRCDPAPDPPNVACSDPVMNLKQDPPPPPERTTTKNNIGVRAISKLHPKCGTSCLLISLGESISKRTFRKGENLKMCLSQGICFFVCASKTFVFLLPSLLDSYSTFDLCLSCFVHARVCMCGAGGVFSCFVFFSLFLFTSMFLFFFPSPQEHSILVLARD